MLSLKTPPRDLFSAAVIASVMRVVSPAVAAQERTAESYSASDLQAWERPSGDVGTTVAATGDERSDGRWLWLFAIGLLSVEMWWRRARRVRSEEAIHARVA
jgi:hypothetical protein